MTNELNTMMRGIRTDDATARAHQILGIENTQAELRLMPYIQYVLLNEQRLEPGKITPEERHILSTWRERGRIEGGAGGLAVTKPFWDAMCELLWLSYVVPEGAMHD